MLLFLNYNFNIIICNCKKIYYDNKYLHILFILVFYISAIKKYYYSQLINYYLLNHLLQKIIFNILILKF